MFAEKVNEVLILGAGERDYYLTNDKCITYSCGNVFACKILCCEIFGI